MVTELSVPGPWSTTRTIRTLPIIIGGVVAVVALLFSVLAMLHEVRGVDVRVLLRDPAETAGIPEYAGAYMFGGVLLLWTAGMIGVLAGLLLRGFHGDPGSASFFLGMGAFLCWLAADDLFMIHEWLGLALSRVIGVENEYLGRTRLEGVVFLSYGAVALHWLWRRREMVARMEPALLAVAVACFGLSAGVDIGGAVLDGVFAAGKVMEVIRAYAEEMLKAAGILFMLVYVIRSARSSVWAVIGGRGAI